MGTTDTTITTVATTLITSRTTLMLTTMPTTRTHQLRLSHPVTARWLATLSGVSVPPLSSVLVFPPPITPHGTTLPCPPCPLVPSDSSLWLVACSSQLSVTCGCQLLALPSSGPSPTCTSSPMLSPPPPRPTPTPSTLSLLSLPSSQFLPSLCQWTLRTLVMTTTTVTTITTVTTTTTVTPTTTTPTTATVTTATTATTTELLL